MGLISFSQSSVKWYQRHLADRATYLRRQIRRAVSSPRLAILYHRFRGALAKRDWESARKRLDALAESAAKAKDTRLLTEMAHAASRLGEYEKATRWAYAKELMAGNIDESDWDGGDLSGATLVIRFKESEKQGMAIGLNMSGYVAEAARQAKECILVVEKRLVPIFCRTLPEVKVLPYPAPVDAGESNSNKTANALTLRTKIGASDQDIEKWFKPLEVDQEQSREMRNAYQAGNDLPLIGISWWSSHFGKDLPSIEVWADLLRTIPALFINIQYGDVSKDLEILKKAAPERVITDESVDQLVDMDRFAAQLGALDAIVTISNTGAHLAGAMKVPTLLIRDDWFRRAWPVRSDRTPWYPATKVFGKEGRPWMEVFKGVKKDLSELTVAGNPPGEQ